MTGTARGLFNVNSISVMVGCKRFDAYTAVFTHLSKAVHDGQAGLRLTAKWSDMVWADLNTDERLAILTTCHENDHFTSFTSSPLGLLLWRTSELQLELIALLVRTLGHCGLDQISPGQDLVTWFNTAGLSFLQLQASHDRLPPLAPEIAQFETVASALKALVREIELLDRFRAVMFEASRPEITIGEFLSLADEVYALLARRWQVPWTARWASRSSRDAPLYPDPAKFPCLTTPELLEGLARLQERRVMEEAGANENQVRDWERDNIKGIYKPGYDLLLAKLSDVPTALSVGHWALATPVDLECKIAHTSEIFVEDVLPIYRIARLSLALNHVKKNWTTDLGAVIDQEGLADTICSIAGLPSVAATLAPVFQNKIVPLLPLRPIVDNLDLSVTNAIPSQLYDYRRYAFSMIEKFQVGHRKLLHLLLPPARLAKIFLENGTSEDIMSGLAGFQEALLDQQCIFAVEPDLTIFRDHITFNGLRKGNRAFSFGDNILHLLFTEACRALVKPTRRMRRPDDLVEMFTSRLQAASKPPLQNDTPLGRALEHERTLELSEEWQKLRTLWPSTEVSLAQFWTYLRHELGPAGERTLKSRLYERPLFI